MKNSWTGGEAAYATETIEENLAVSVRRKEPGAFERLIDRYEAPLFNYAHGLLQNRMDAQEVVQDALMGAHRSLSERYDERRCAALALRPWLFRAVRNLCLNKRRSKGRSLERPLREFDDGRIGPFVRKTGSEIERQEESELLRQAISGLPVEARELIVLRFMEEMPYAEIAKTVGSREAALRGKVFRALKLLREAVEKKGVTHAM
jgi:RNA polymerase sigma-70 factor (ECF subfamily)